MTNYPQNPGPQPGPQPGSNPGFSPGPYGNSPSQPGGYGSQPAGNSGGYGSQPGSYGGYGSQPAGNSGGYGSQPGSYGNMSYGSQPTYGNTSYTSQNMGGGMPPGFGQPGPDGTVPLNQPWYGIGFKDACIRFFKKYARFNGYASRGEFWWPMLGVFVVQLVLMIPYFIGAIIVAASTATSVDPSTGDLNGGSAAGAGIGTLLMILGGLLIGAWSLATVIPSIAITIRRLHDAGFSGWFYLLNFVASIVVLILCALETKPAKWQQDWYDNS